MDREKRWEEEMGKGSNPGGLRLPEFVFPLTRTDANTSMVTKVA